MKLRRKFWALLAVTLAALALLATAQAADELAFTTQPTVGPMDTENLTYPVSWATGFTPVRVELYRSDKLGTDDWDRFYIASAHASMTDSFGTSYWGYSYVLRAYYRYLDSGNDANRYVDSLPFTLSVSDPALSFITQPTVGPMDTEKLFYPVSWATGFTPVRVELYRSDKLGTNDWDRFYIASAHASMTDSFGTSSWGYSYVLRAYYRYLDSGNDANRYVDSQPFTPSVSDPALSFITQPTVGPMDTEKLIYPVSWATGFTPVRVELYRSDKLGTNDWDRFYIASAHASMTDSFSTSSWGYSYVLRAYYRYLDSGNDANRYVDSLPFSLEIHTVTFDANGGTGSMGSVDLVGAAPSYQLPACGFTRADHEFVGWSVQGELYQPGDSVTITENTTVHATWKRICTITYNANGGTGAIASQTVLEGTVITLPENSFVRENYNFSYWALSSYPNSRFQPGRNVTITSSTTITAVWVQKVWCTLTFDMQGYGAQIAPLTVEKGTLATEPKPTSSLRFACWEVNVGYAMDVWVPFDFDQPVTQSATLRAHWVSNAMRKVKLFYNKEAGTVTLTAEGMDGDMVPVSERVHINIETNPHWDVDWIYIGTLQTHNRAFDMPNQDSTSVRVTFTLDHEHNAQTLNVYQPYLAPTCEEEGHGLIYYCPTCDHYYNGSYKWLEDQAAMDALVLPALGHEWGAPTYTWAADGSTATATRVCTHDPSHLDTETVNTTAEVTLEPGPFTRGAHTYTAVFENPAFAQQTYTLDDIEPLGIPVTEAIFPDRLFRGIVSNRADTDGNGYLSQAEREAVTHFDASNQSVVTFRGIEYFPNLMNLQAKNNWKLEELDLSANTHLKILNLNGSSNKLTTLDLSANPEMEEVTATNCYAATVIVTHCPSLRKLIATGSHITSLDLSGNPALTELNVNNAALTSLDLSGNPALETLIAYGCTQLTELDISHQPGLKRLELYSVNIPALDIHQNPYLVQAYQTGSTSGSSGYTTYSANNGSYKLILDNDISVYAAEALIQTGSFGDVLWRFNRFTGSLVIDSDSPAAIPNFAMNASPFTSLNGLRTVTIQGDITGIGNFAFYNCGALTSVSMTSHVASIGNAAFCNTGITTIELPEGLSSLGESALAGCESLTEITIPAGVTQLANNLFLNCPSLKNVTLSPTLTAIGECCFEDCTSLERVTFPGNSAKWNTVTVAGGNQPLTPAVLHMTPEELPIYETIFPDAAFRAYVYNNFDDDKTGWLNDQEISAATEIDAYEHNATGFGSLAGIEHLTHLYTLNFSDSPLVTQVDLSANTNIHILDVWNTGLTSLNVTGLPLTTLYLSNSPIESITLGQQPNLKVLSLRTKGHLADLDISGCPRVIDILRYGERTTESSGLVSYVDSAWNELTVEENVRLITGVVWRVIFDSQGGTPVAEQCVAIGGTAQTPALPAREGFGFTGWYTDPACGEGSRYSFDSPVTDEVRLYAGWYAYAADHVLRLPAQLTEIDEGAFEGVAAQAVEIPATVTAIHGNPFAGSAVRVVIGSAGSEAQRFALDNGLYFAVK